MVVRAHSLQSQHLGMEGRSIKSLMPGLGWGRDEDRKLFIKFRNKIHWNLWHTRHPTILSLLLKNQNLMLANSVRSTRVMEGVSGLYSHSSQSRSRVPRENLGTTGTIPDHSFIFVFSAGQGAGDSPPDGRLSKWEWEARTQSPRLHRTRGRYHPRDEDTLTKRWRIPSKWTPSEVTSYMLWKGRYHSILVLSPKAWHRVCLDKSLLIRTK